MSKELQVTEPQENISDILSLTNKQALHWPTEASVPAVVLTQYLAILTYKKKPISSSTSVYL